MKATLLLLAALVGLFEIVSSASSTPKDIPGTNLKTRTFYKLGLKRFPKGYITWTEQGNSLFNYVQIDNNPEHLSKYQPGGPLHLESSWEFVPVIKKGNETGWYGLRNRGRRGACMTWSLTDYIDSTKLAIHVILEKNYSGNPQKGDVFLKPVKVQNGTKAFYQIKLRNLPKGVFTWDSQGYEKMGSYYIEVDNFEGHQAHYKEGGKWYEDTLFYIGKPENETPEEQALGDLEPYSVKP